MNSRARAEYGADGRRAYRVALDRVRVQFAGEARPDPDEVEAIDA